LVSTNFDICGKEDSTSCKRYPIVNSILKNQDAGFQTMLEICKRTGGDITMYSNIQNLTTGEVWFFSKHDPKVMIKTNITNLLSKGRKSYTFSDLNSLIEDRPFSQLAKPTRIELTDNAKAKYLGEYSNDFTGQLTIDKHQDGIKITSLDGNVNVVQAQTENSFFLPNEDVIIKFNLNKETKQITMSLYENGFWIFDALKLDSKGGPN
jgi:hypothetical protein